jgi:twinkle protein
MINPSASKSTTATPSVTATTAAGLSEEARKILQERGLKPETAEKLGFRSSKKTSDGSVWLEIPYFRDGVEVNTKRRTIRGDKRFFQDEGGVQCFYNVDAIKDWDAGPLLICEGELDAASAVQCGYRAVSVPGGAPAKPVEGESSKYDFLKELPNSGEIILCVDNDGPGANLLQDLSVRIGRHRCKWIKYPKNCKDLNDALRIYGEKGVVAAIGTAEWLRVDGVYSLSELPPLPKPERHRISFLDSDVYFRKSDFNVLTGIPSHGKSTFMNCVAFDAADKSGWRTAFASFEQSPQVQHKQALRSMYLRRPAHLASDTDIAEADDWIEQHFSFIVPDDFSDEMPTLTWLLNRMAAAVVQKGADMIVIDPWNEVEHDYDGRSMTETQYISFAIRQIQRFARKYQTCVWVVVHPTKLKPAKPGEPPPVPEPYDCNGGANWYNKAYFGGTIYRDAQKNVLFRHWKSKYWADMGEPKDHKLRFDDYRYLYEATK